jgi:hypothetical protein
MKWQHYIYHTEKMKNVNSKNCQSSVKIKIKDKTSLNKEFVNEAH